MTKLFGPNRIRPGYEDQEWAVWITGMDDVTQQPTVEAALAYAADHNAVAASLYDGSPLNPVTYAVVLHHGYAWSADVEHCAGRDCGVKGCVHCGTDRNITLATLADRWGQMADHWEARADELGEGVVAATRDARGRTYRKAARDLREVLTAGRIPHDLMTDAELNNVEVTR